MHPIETLAEQGVSRQNKNPTDKSAGFKKIKNV
jgi:hypothetical protein